ncbi:aminoacyl--tRNA ligase-related protein [Blastococcus sp. CCUG 61487]|uniref:aminoacyl--tRNA ligase-related protein n=1 Tax=Blastococcus sp. CCUG 61487 TaxID=1840703 RepID=UPI0010C0D370|nr:aminoacyl--tRNA ligase-related protein [Blastococcus sp. CCUG 61487]TKJ21335.1 hypothetical protein A6V29_07620 [Blastococcus sp. CCUG 61487]
MLHNVTVSFERPYDARLSDELSRRVLYLAEGIESFHMVHEEGRIVGLQCQLTAEADPTEISAKIRRGLSRELDGLSRPRPRVSWNTDDVTVGSAAAVLEEARQNRTVREHGPGQVSLGGHLAELFEVLDAMVTQRIRGHGAQELKLPVLLPKQVLDAAGYFESFPQYLMLVGRLRSDVDIFDEFAQLASRRSLPEIEGFFDRGSVATEYALPPTMCYYVYDLVAREGLTENAVYTARGPSFRFEHGYHSPLARLWDFTIRETVFLGHRDYVDEHLDQLRGEIIGLADELGLRGRCETASDPFFMTAAGVNRINVQRMTDAKSELQLRLDPERSIAVASFNRHGQYLTKRFDLTADAEDRQTVTACVGVGLERLLFAFIAQLGLDEAAWPEPVRERLEQWRSWRS